MGEWIGGCYGRTDIQMEANREGFFYGKNGVCYYTTRTRYAYIRKGYPILLYLLFLMSVSSCQVKSSIVMVWYHVLFRVIVIAFTQLVDNGSFGWITIQS